MMLDPSGTGEGVPVVLMEQLLEQVEGSPAYLLRNQFMLEEQRLLDDRGSRIYEPRPW